MDAGRSMRVATAVTFLAMMGVGLPAAASAAVPPSAPREVTAAAGDETIIVAWLPPLDDGGAPILGYHFRFYAYGTLIYHSPLIAPATTATFTGNEEGVWNDDLEYRILMWAVNEAGGAAGAWSNPVTPIAGAVAPAIAVVEISPDGGFASTGAVGEPPSPSNPVVTEVTVPPTLGGGTLSISETTVSTAPAGYTFLGQDVFISSTAATDAANPLRLVFRVDPAFVPVTIFRNGSPVTEACLEPGRADPTPCVESGAGTAEITILTAAASTWNVGFADYHFSGFTSPIDNLPVTNLAKAGRAIPVRFGLGGDAGLNILRAAPAAREVPCATGAPTDGIEETATSPSALSYSVGTGLYQLAWGTERSWANSCRELILRFRDGSEARARFEFRGA